MSTQIVNGLLYGPNGTVPLQKTITDGSDSQELMTDVTFTVTQQSVGRFADGWTLTHGAVWATTGICYAYFLRNGQNIGNVQSLGTNALGGMQEGVCKLSNPIRIIPGDQLIVRTEA
tara:strand:+ start:2256 stop:2606 length:351 start_codon:yes stop_codon:yes gene_type:complete